MSDAPLILALDTSSVIQSLAIIQGDQALATSSRRARADHGAVLLTALDQLLQEQELTCQDLDLIVAGLGPGGFTGLRVGLATAKGLASALGLPLIGVDSLASMAYRLAMTTGLPTWSAIDARRREVYAGLYQRRGDTLVTLSAPRAYDPAQLAASLTADYAEVCWIGHRTDSYAPLQDPGALPGVRAMPALHAQPDPVGMAALGAWLYATRGPDDLIALEPNYIRPSDAELSLAARKLRLGPVEATAKG